MQSSTQYYQAKEIGQSTLVSISTVWEALDEAAGVLFDTTVATTNTVLKHKYGTNVADTVTVCVVLFVFTPSGHLYDWKGCLHNSYLCQRT